MPDRPYQIKREDLTDEEWDVICKLFALILFFRSKLDAVTPENRSSSEPERDPDSTKETPVTHRRDS